MKFLHRIPLLALLGICCLYVNPSTGQSPWHLGGHLSGGFSGKNETSFFQSDPSDSNQSFNRIQQRRQPLVGGGLWGTYSWGKHLKIRLGLEYVQARSFHTNESGGYNAFGTLSSYQERKWKVLLHQLQLPFQVEWYLGKQSWRPFVGFGIAPQRSLGGKFSSEFSVVRAGFDDINSAQGLDMDWGAAPNRAEAWSVPFLFSAGVEWGKFTLSLRHIAGQGFAYDAMPSFPDNVIWEINPYNWIRETAVRRSTSLQISYQIF